MEIVINDKHEKIIFLDCEYDGQDMRQLAAIAFTKSKHGYQLVGSLNRYIVESEDPSDFFVNFTAITPQFLNEYGVTLEQAKQDFQNFIGIDDTLIVAHNLKSDTSILFKNGINVEKYDTYCTWSKAKQYFKNEKSYNVENLAAREGWFLGSPHDAFYDAWALVPIFCALKEWEGEHGETQENKLS